MTGVEPTILGLVASIIMIFTAPDKATLAGMIVMYTGSLFLAASMAVYLIGRG